MAAKVIIEWLILDLAAAKQLQFILQVRNGFILLLQSLGLKDGLSLLLGEIVMTNLGDLM